MLQIIENIYSIPFNIIGNSAKTMMNTRSIYTQVTKISDGSTKKREKKKPLMFAFHHVIIMVNERKKELINKMEIKQRKDWQYAKGFGAETNAHNKNVRKLN